MRTKLRKKNSIYSICIALSLLQSGAMTLRSFAAEVAAPGMSTPVDIQAAEEEFADDQVIAKGNVKVTYKDSVVHAPMARLFRDAEGQPQRAVFVGHSVLVQGDSTIMGDTLVFEISTSRVVAQGNAHSEVVSSNDDANSSTPASSKTLPSLGAPAATSATKSKSNAPKTATAKAPQAKSGAGKAGFQWPHEGDENDIAASPTAAQNNTNDAAGSSDTEHSTSTGESSSKKPVVEGHVEKIITDSDLQEYEKESGKFDASGHVHVINGDISIYADKLRLVYGTDGKPETALFTGNVDATRNSNNTKADLMTYYLVTKRLQATGNVRSKVIEKAPASQKPTTVGTTDDATNQNTIGSLPVADGGAANAAPVSSAKAVKDNTILIVSDAQDNSELTGRMTANGNVKVYYQDTVGVGPKAVLVRNPQGQADRVIFSGRSQITQPGKRWIADRLTFTPSTKKVLAEGNTKAFIFQAPPSKNNSPATPDSKPKSNADNEQLAKGPANKNTTSVSSSKVETIR